MAQVTIYLQDELEEQARKAAELRGTSIAGWITELVAETLKNRWPPEAIGSFPDFSEEAELSRGYGKNAARERLS